MDEKIPNYSQSYAKYAKSSSVEIYVAGTRFEIPKKNILKHPGTLLEKMLPKLNREKEGDVTFNRPDDSFKAIHSFYLTGKLHMPLNLCPGEFAEEMEYWGIQPEILEPCCLYRFLSFKHQEETSKQFRKSISSTTHHKTTSEGSSWRMRLWLILDYRVSSPLAKVYLAITLLFVLLSLASLSLSTLPMFQRKLTICETRDLIFYDNEYDDDVEEYFNTRVDCSKNAEESIQSYLGEYARYTDEEFNKKIEKAEDQMQNSSTYSDEDLEDLKLRSKLKKIKLPNKFARLQEFDLIDLIVLAVFTVDLFLRLITCPSIVSYYKSALNIIDSFVLVSGIIGYVLEKYLINFTYDSGNLDVLIYMQQLRVFRLLRVVQHVAAIEVLGFCFKSNFKEIMVLLLFLFVGVNFFANMLYFLEHKTVSSIPQAWWWGLITMTTVDYGDIYPVTAAGRIVGAFCAISGVIVLALIIPLFVTNFIALYELAYLFDKKQNVEPKVMQVKVRPT